MSCKIPPSIAVDTAIDRLYRLTGTKNDCQLAAFFGIHQSTVSSWRKNGTLPDGNYEKIAEDFAQELRIGTLAMERIKIKSSDVAEALGITQRAVAIMRKENRFRYDMIIDALKLQKAQEIAANKIKRK